MLNFKLSICGHDEVLQFINRKLLDMKDLMEVLMKRVGVFPQSFISPSAFDRSHCRLQRDNDGSYLVESWIWKNLR